MATLAAGFDTTLDAIRSAVATLSRNRAEVKALSDPDLLRAQRELSDCRREIDAASALVAGEVSHRSRRELGYDGLAQREGFRTPEALVQHETGSTARAALTLVRVGTMVHDALADEGSGSPGSSARAEAWSQVVGAAVNSGALSLEAANAIRSGLGASTAREGAIPPTAEQLAAAARTLILESTLLHADALYRRARAMRDDLDAAGIADRESAIHGERSFRRTRRANGLPRYIIDPDIESAAYWDDVYDKLTSPRRGGVRFVTEADRAWAGAIATDDRSIEQYLHDAFTQLLRIAVSAESTDSRRIIGSRQPAVRVLVTRDALNSRQGHGRIEGSDAPVSLETVERIACESGTIQLVFDDTGQPLDVGREQRLFTPRQRIALAARDGGCLIGDCDRPPSWCEAHHIDHWKRDGGETNVADGVLLCRHHHLLVHNNRWEIARDHSGYWLIPPPEVDPAQAPRPMPSKSAALRDLQRPRRSAEPGRVGGSTDQRITP